jgi:Leucine-rich repeat (LRR) protein
MGNIREAGRRIAAIQASGEEELLLSGLELTTEELRGLIPQVEALPGLRRLDVSNNRLARGLPAEIGNLTDLTALDVSGSYLRELPDATARLTNLRVLNVSDNKLAELPEGIAGLINLTELLAEKNDLDVLPDIGPMTNLSVLNISHNHISELPDIGNLVNLTELLMEDNDLDELPAIDRLTSLRVLNVSGNNLRTLPDMGRLQNLTELSAASNSLEELPDISNLANLHKLDVASNDLREIDNLDNLFNLKELELSENKLTELPDISSLVNVDKLYISDNNLRELPDINNLVNLTELDVSENYLTELPFIGNLTKLAVLNVSYNELNALPDGVENLTALTELNVSKIGGSADLSGINKLRNLTKLHLAENDLTELPDMHDLTKISQLYISDNYLSYLPPCIANFTELTLLDASYNRFIALPPGLTGLPQLTDLNMSGNHLQELPASIGNLGRLRQLNISDNQLEQLPPELCSLENLSRLQAAGNNLVSLPEELWDMPGLEALILDNNPLSEDTMERLDSFSNDHEHIHISYNMAAHDPGQSCDEVLAALYEDGQERDDIRDKLEACDRELGPVMVGDGEMAVQKSAQAALKEFLNHVPVAGAGELELYGDAARSVVGGVLDPTRGIEERKDNLAKLGVALGDCGTAVKEHLLRERMAGIIARAQDGILSERDRRFIEREAVSAAADRLLHYRANERIEQKEGLMNLLYLENAENHPDNDMLRIEGERDRWPSGTGNIAYAFRQLETLPQLVEGFALLTCRTDADGNLLKTDSGACLLDRGKIEAITDSYMTKQGLAPGASQAEREKYADRYAAEIKAILQDPEVVHLSSHYEDPAVERLLDIPSGQQELRVLLGRAPVDMEQEYEKYLDKARSEIKTLARKHAPEKEELSQMRAPVNERKRPRSPSPGGGNGTGVAGPSGVRNVKPRR